MKVVNPYGRTVSTSMEETHFAVHPRACMCSWDGGDYSGTRGSGDHCFHCGCSCGMSSDNDFTATYTIRES